MEEKELLHLEDGGTELSIWNDDQGAWRISSSCCGCSGVKLTESAVTGLRYALNRLDEIRYPRQWAPLDPQE